MYQYLREIRERELSKQENKVEDNKKQKERLKEIADEIKKDHEKNKEEKALKINKMKSNIAEVKAEREAAVSQEHDYRMK